MSTPHSRKRTKWDKVNDDEGMQESQPMPPPKRRGGAVSAPSASVVTPRRRETFRTSKYVPPRTAYPALLPSRSVYCYERLNQIEEGSYGVVFRAREKQTGDIVALKKLKLDEEKHGFPITSLREINSLMLCRHENVVGIREVVVGDTLTQCVLPYFSLVYFANPSLLKSIHCHGFY